MINQPLDRSLFVDLAHQVSLPMRQTQPTNADWEYWLNSSETLLALVLPYYFEQSDMTLERVRNLLCYESLDTLAKISDITPLPGGEPKEQAAILSTAIRMLTLYTMPQSPSL